MTITGRRRREAMRMSSSPMKRTVRAPTVIAKGKSLEGFGLASYAQGSKLRCRVWKVEIVPRDSCFEVVLNVDELRKDADEDAGGC